MSGHSKWSEIRRRKGAPERGSPEAIADQMRVEESPEDGDVMRAIAAAGFSAKDYEEGARRVAAALADQPSAAEMAEALRAFAAAVPVTVAVDDPDAKSGDG